MSAQTHAPAWMAPLQALVENRLPSASCNHFIGLIGDHPSTYARSPRIWQPALEALGIDAAYLSLDVRAERLSQVVQFLRRSDACLGANVTVPYKETVVPFLNETDATTHDLGAVNTIVRASGGRLIGANTDGVGLIDALLRPADGPLIVQTLRGATILLIGAGGAARAAAVALAPLLESGELLVTNRTLDPARAIVSSVSRHGCRASVVPEPLLDRYLSGVTLVINATTRGQAGIFKQSSADDREMWTCLEPYSALAPASPASLPAMPEDAFFEKWSAASAADIGANHALSRERVRLLPADAVVFDMIYAPSETVLLQHARQRGLRTANGRGMNIAQAVAACVDHICHAWILRQGVDTETARGRVLKAMARAWGA